MGYIEAQGKASKKRLFGDRRVRKEYEEVNGRTGEDSYCSVSSSAVRVPVHPSKGQVWEVQGRCLRKRAECVLHYILDKTWSRSSTGGHCVRSSRRKEKSQVNC